MCELVVRVHAVVGSAVLNVGARVMQVGDVVDVRENNWPWQRMDLSLPFWRIIHVQDMYVNEAELLMQEGKTQLRIRGLDIRAAWLPSDFIAWIDDDSRATPIYNLTADIVRRMVVAKNPADRLHVIG